MAETPRQPVVRYLDQTAELDCPFGHVRRVVTGGAGGVANVHVVSVSAAAPHSHAGYDEVYYVLAGQGVLVLDGREHPLRPGAVAVIPRGVVHSLQAAAGQELQFVIFGHPPMSAEDDRCRPMPPGRA